VVLLGGLLVLACGQSKDGGGKAADDGVGGGSGSGGSGSPGSGGLPGGGSSATGGSSGKSSGSGGSSGSGASGGTSGKGGSAGSETAGDAGSGEAGAPDMPPLDTGCDIPVAPVDTSSPTTVVGDGSAASCSDAGLRAAVAQGGIVTFDCGDAPVTITVDSEIPVTDDTTIDGGGMVTLSGGGKSRVLHIASPYDVPTPLLTLQHVAFEDGFTTDEWTTLSAAESGGAIFADGGSVTIIDCAFSNNQCAFNGQNVTGGAVGGEGAGTIIIVASTFTGNTGSNGGAVGTRGKDITIVNSTFTDNQATGTYGHTVEGGDGGAISQDAADHSLTLCGDTFTGNVATASGGALWRRGFDSQGNDIVSLVDISRSTFDHNGYRASPSIGGAISVSDVTLKISDSTVSNNLAGTGAGGIFCGDYTVMDFTNVTIVNNTSLGGGGIQLSGGVTGKLSNVTIAGNEGDGLYGSGNQIMLENCIIANNVPGLGDPSPSCDGPFLAEGQNIQFPMGGSACAPGITFVDPELGALQDNGGPTLTLRPAADSPAIGAGTACPPTDQTGATRPAACTLGAIEGG